MKLFRKVIFWCHLVAGVFAGVVVLVMSVTGVLLAYERQVTAWADTRGYHVAPPARARPACPSRLCSPACARRVPARLPPSPCAPTRPRRPRSASGARASSSSTLTRAKCSAKGRGRRGHSSTSSRTGIAGSARGEGAGRTVGRAVTGACNLAFLFLVVSGFYLWWPRTWTRKTFRSVTWFRRGLGGKARDFNWHNVTGFWSALPLFVVVLSGSRHLLHVGGQPRLPRDGRNAARAARRRTRPARRERRAGARRRGGPRRCRHRRQPVEGNVEQLLARAEQQSGDWRSISLRLPTPNDPTVTFTLDRGDGGQPQKRAQLTLDRQDGRGRALGAVLEPDAGAAAPLAAAVRAHRRGGRRLRADSRRARVGRRRRCSSGRASRSLGGASARGRRDGASGRTTRPHK